MYEFSLSHKVSFVKNPISFTLHPVEFHLPRYHDGLETREVGRMTEDIQNRILPTSMQILSAPHGQDRTSLIQVSSSSHQHGTIAENKVTWFLAARGQKVLALLSVPGHTLSSRFFGSFVIEKKLNDLNYIIVTPGKRK